MSHWHIVLLLLKLLTISVAIEQKLLRINTDLTAIAANNATTAPVASPIAAPMSTANQREVVLAAESHICMREETYVEQLKVPSMQPVRIRSSEWCLEFPPRCSNYKTEMREIVQVQNITKTRTIRFCCAGYEGNISINDTICKPVCRGGCGRGHCQTPDVCNCEPGYTGTHCTQRCDHDHWGEECKNECQCQNGAACDNKSGLCHCTSGWTGEFCQLPCPSGTYGVMCTRQCECPLNECHPQTGACLTSTTPSGMGVTPNATHVMIETLNSTIVNITHNLDRIAQNIVNIATSSANPVESPEQPSTATTLKSIPEVIVIKQDGPQSPKIIVHQPSAGGLLEDLHSAGAKTPEVIHVITAAAGWPVHTNGSHTEHKLELASFGGAVLTPTTIGSVTEMAPPSGSAAEHDANLLTTLLIILLIIMIAIAMSFLYIYKRYHWQKARVARNACGSAASTAEIGDARLCEAPGGGKSYLKPLPDLPGFTQMVHNKIEGPEFYDSPSNNSSIHTASYDYARKLSLYSVIAPKSRKSSPDSHLYDEIHYPSAFHHHHHSQHPHEAQQQGPHRHHHHHHQHHQPPRRPSHPHGTQQTIAAHHIAAAPVSSATTAQHHITHLIIPPQNANYLQVPPMANTNTMRKVALL